MKKLIESVMDIEGKDYVEVPKCCDGISGSIGAAFSIKKRDGKLWVPKKRLDDLKKTMADIKKDLEEGDIF